MKKIFYLLAMLVLASSFTLPANDPFVTGVLRNLLMRVKSQPQEKVYLQTDREHYSAGENIWFRAYLLDAVTHKPSDYSRYVYVELVDRMDSVRLRVKIRQTDSIFAGFLPLSKEMKQGEYFVRAYSYWMQNAGEDFIFKKKIRLVNVQDSKVHTHIKYVGDGEQIEISFTNSRKDVYDKVSVEYECGGKYKIGRTDEKGVLRLSARDLGEDRNVVVRFRASEPFEFERLLTIPKPDQDFDLQFFPEGGDLLAGNVQTIAFKAIGTDGFGKDVEGSIYNDKEEFVTAIKSMHRGMGGFDLKPEAGRRYHAVVTSSDQVKKTVELPVPKRVGLGLKVWQRDSTLTYSVLAGDSTEISENLYLAVLSRGVPLLCTPLTRTVGRLPVNVLPEGVVQLVLMNAKSEIYSQRMCFIRKNVRPEVKVETDKKTYAVRDRVGVSIDVAAVAGQDLSGSFSVAVTDDVQNTRDSSGQNILSYVLLTSDLKGYIEDPAFYFTDVNRNTERSLDFLMMTQGWTRFDLPEVIRGEFPELPYYLEQGQAISGYVKNFWGKDALDAKLMVFSTNKIIETVSADSSGYFMLDGIAFPDSTKFFVQALSKKGRRTVELQVEKEQFLRPEIKFPYNVESIQEEDDFYNKFRKDYYYENGIKVYVLDEAVVVRKKAPTVYSMYDFAATYGVDSAKLAGMADLDMRQVLETIPGIRVDEIEKTVSRMSKSLLFLVNDFEEDFDYVMTLRPADLLNISYLDGIQAGSLIGENAGGGALVITTNPNFVRGAVQRLNVSILSFLGYQKPAEFYMPKYGVDSVRRALAKVADERSTIYWNPNVCTDASGKAEFSFYTSDSYGPYTLIIEGVLNDGTVCRRERKIMLKSPGI